MNFGIPTDRLVQPLGVEYHDRKGYFALHTPSRRDFRGGNKIVLASPPPSGHRFERELVSWSEEYQAIPAVDYAYIQWEGPTDLRGSHWNDPVHPAFGAWEKEKDCVMVLGDELSLSSGTDYALSEVQNDQDWAGIVELVLEDVGAEHEDFYRWQVQAARQRVEGCSKSQWWVVKDGNLVIGSAGIIVGEKFARFQEVRTRQAYRRQGIAANLCGQIAEVTRSRFSEQDLVIIAGDGESSMRIYERLGFETRSYLWTLTGGVSQ